MQKYQRIIRPRRLATANRSRGRMHVTKIFATVRGVVNPVIFPLISLITLQNLVDVCHRPTVWAYIRGPKKVCSAGIPPFRRGVVSVPLETCLSPRVNVPNLVAQGQIMLAQVVSSTNYWEGCGSVPSEWSVADL